MLLRSDRLTSLLVLFGLWVASPAVGGLLFETATTEFEGNPGRSYNGAEISADGYHGAEFVVNEPVRVTAIGGHFHLSTIFNDTNEIFGAIIHADDGVQLSDLDNELVSSTLIVLPEDNRTANVAGELLVDLQPGRYAVVFGSGRFGAPPTAASAAWQRNGFPFNRSIEPTFRLRVSDGFFQSPHVGVRYFIEGGAVPEPSSVAITLAASIAPLAARRS